jgi:3-oxoacyl-[acyl-carrier protein] reductase
MDLVDKVAFVTGGSGDIGRAIAIALAGAGVDIVVSYVSSEERAASTVDAIREMGRRGLAVHLNQRDPIAIKVACDKVIAAFNRIDILVNNAAWNIGIPFKDLDALTAEIWDQMLETNLRGPYLLARAFAPELRRHKTGRIINIASVSGIMPGGSSIAYASSKAALIHLTRCLAVALAPEVTVNCIAPGLVEGTRMAERVPEETKRSIRGQAVLGRTGSAQDMAEHVVTFCRAESITGQTLAIDGGLPSGMR